MMSGKLARTWIILCIQCLSLTNQSAADIIKGLPQSFYVLNNWIVALHSSLSKLTFHVMYFVNHTD